jgi:Ribbon-helix-helix protein, copG family
MTRKRRPKSTGVPTSGGVPVTEKLIDELAAEAERGYAPEKLRKRGRPPLGAGPSEIVPVRLDQELRRALEERAADEDTTQSDLVRRALRTFLAAERDREGDDPSEAANEEPERIVAAPGEPIAALRRGRDLHETASEPEAMTDMSAFEAMVSAPDAVVLDPRQREIRELLKLIGPEPMDFFTDACRIVDGAAGVSTQTHLAAHALREIEGRLHEVFDPMLTREARAKIVEAGKNEESHRAKIEAAAEILGLDEPTLELWLEYALPLHKLAHRVGLAGPRDVAEFRDHFASGQSVLLAVLRRLQTIYIDARPLVQELAGVRGPTKGHMKRLRNRVPHSTVILGEFFSTARLDWFPLLREEGYFENPPPLEVDEEGRVAFAEWPAARFLTRAAAVEELQDDVVEILNALDTDNPEARDATVEAALAMTPARAARLATKIADYLGGSDTWWTPRHSEELVTHLVEGGEVAAALEITKPLLAPAPRTADWGMRHAFTDLVPKLFPAVGLEGLALLRDLLAQELTVEGRDSANDLSTIWRESIVGGPDMRRRDLLVTALNSAADALVASSTATLREVVETLANDERAIFSRIALHLIADHPEPDIAAEWLGNEDLFRNFNLEREYAELAQVAFAGLDRGVEEEIFGWIEHGPTWRPRDLPEDEFEEYDAQWRLRELRRLPERPQEWQQRFDELVARFGDPADPLAPRMGRAAWSGTRSPKSKEELLELSDDGFLDFVRTWEPDGDWLGPSVEGLANELRDAAVAEPERFSRLLPELADGEPTYARNVVYGLQQVARDGGALEWEPILDFARRILGLPARLEGRDPAGDEVDPGWEWSRLEVARLLSSGLGRKSIPEEFRDEVWQVIAALAEDDDPAVETEDEREREGTQPEILSLNSVRACAIEAAIRFAAWSADDESGMAERPATLPQNVREVLDRHLDPERERTRTVQAVFGRHFNQLYSLDPEWTTERVAAIFPDDPRRARHRDTAWRAFIDANRFWPTSWEALAPQYRRAVEGLADERFEEEDVSLLDPTGALLGHVLSAYLNDLIELSDDSLLGVFFETAPLRLRRTFLEMIGTDLSGDHDVSERVRTKLQRLWEWRAEKVFAEGNVTELAGFDWWFGSGKLPHEWSVEQLVRVLEAGGGVTFDYVVTQRLPDLAAKDLSSAVRIMAALVEHAYTPHMVLSAREPFRTVLAAALTSGDGELVETARMTISRLYAERHIEFNDLLDQ